MAHKLKRVQNDTGESITFNVELDGSAKDLTGCTVNFIMKSPTDVASNAGHTACTVNDATNGVCTYTFQAGDLAEEGLYTCDLQMTDAAGLIITEFEQYEITVRAENG